MFDVIGRGGGRPLDDELRRAMEDRLGQPFETVRVHVDARSTESVDAAAYTVGEEIVVHPNFARLGTADGRKLLAHELAHVIQQRRGPVDGRPAPGGITLSEPSDRFERAADATARVAINGGAAAGAAAAAGEAVAQAQSSPAVAQAPSSPGSQADAVTVQRSFTHNKKKVPPAKLPRIHGAKPADLQKLADDGHDYGTLTDAGSVTTAMQQYQANHPVVRAQVPLDQIYAGWKTVWTDDDFGVHNAQTVRATFQLDAGQGKHDDDFATDKDARHKGGGQKMPSGTDYETLAQGVPAELAQERLARIFAKPARQGLDFSVQNETQRDGYQYEISAMWEPDGAGFHLLVYYHCYPPRS